MSIFKKILEKRFWVVLIVIIAISYGQILWMQPWQDDNALFFKLANLEGPAGFLGKGPLGEGAYKYTAAFYIPIYKIFGFQPVAYFSFAFVLYFLATYTIYKVLTFILDETSGKVAGFMYASGYIASDGFIRLFNTVVTSISIILISLLTLSYWKFYKEKKNIWIVLSLLLYWAVVEFVPARSHYLFSIIVLFEIIYFSPWKSFESLAKSLVRISPFFLVFYSYFILNADSRSGQVKEFALGVVKGNFYLLHGMFSSIANLVLPDWIQDFLLSLNTFLLVKTQIPMPYLYIMFFGLLIIVIGITIKYQRRFTIPGILLLTLLVVWALFSQEIFNHPTLTLGMREYFLAFTGGAFLIITTFYGFFLDFKYKNLFFILFFWLLVNIAAYSAYSSTVVYETINRYHAHSFFALVLLITVIIFNLQKSTTYIRNSALFLIILLGLGNAIGAFFYQRNVVAERSFPTKDFYISLKNNLPEIKKGDILYFDISEDARARFANAFSVAQMPETTAIAWRYGLDRYDFQMTTQFNELINLIMNTEDIDKVHAFYYSKNGLENKTVSVRQNLKSGKQEIVDFKVNNLGNNDLEIEFEKPLEVSTPIQLQIELVAKALNPQIIDFPTGRLSNNSIFANSTKRKLALMYGEDKDRFYQEFKVTTTSEWRDRNKINLIDDNLETVWQADRVLWSQERASLTLELGSPQNIDRFVWVNAFESNSPTKYTIDISTDGVNWNLVKEVSSIRRISNQSLEVVEFPPTLSRFVRMNLIESLNSDSPGIAEAWVVSDTYKDIDIVEAEEFLNTPFHYVGNREDFIDSLNRLNFRGKANIYWLSNNNAKWQLNANTSTYLNYNNSNSRVNMVIPAGGTEAYKIKLADFEIPGTIEISKIRLKWLNLIELRE